MAIALVLACLFKTFLAELFVIPTGSMAPTLRGLHKDVPAADGTHYWHAYGVPEDPGTIDAAITPLYGERMALEEKQGVGRPERESKPYSGDRILVNKFAYAVADPQRWDVVVFKCPVDASTNYIKRLVGKAGETVRIHRGDLWVKAPGADAFEVAAKPLPKMNDMRQIVFDTDYAIAPDKGWPPERWVDGSAPESWAGAWKVRYVAKNYRGQPSNAEFDLSTPSPQYSWLRYQHTLPTVEDWRKYKSSEGREVPQVRRRLVTDFSPYNSGTWTRYEERGFPIEGGSSTAQGFLGGNWVGDLCVEAEIDVQEAATPDSMAALELVKAGEAFQLRFRLSDGTAELHRGATKIASSQQPTPLRGVGRHTVAFYNFDNRLEALVDGARIVFDASTVYTPLPTPVPTAQDLFPAAVGGLQVKLAAQHLRVWRDIYYIAEDSGTAMTDFHHPFRSVGEWADFFASPERWTEIYKTGLKKLDFPLKEDQFFVLGDNSSSSSDARYWTDSHYVERRLLLGKALLIYWPHGWETPWNVEVSSDFLLRRRGFWGAVQSATRSAPSTIRVPFYPNFGRMKFIH